jgi:hypothetical protein
VQYRITRSRRRRASPALRVCARCGVGQPGAHCALRRPMSSYLSEGAAAASCGGDAAVSDKASRLCSISGLFNACTLREAAGGFAGGADVRIITDEPAAGGDAAKTGPRASPLPTQARGRRVAARVGRAWPVLTCGCAPHARAQAAGSALEPPTVTATPHTPPPPPPPLTPPPAASTPPAASPPLPPSGDAAAKLVQALESAAASPAATSPSSQPGASLAPPPCAAGPAFPTAARRALLHSQRALTRPRVPLCPPQAAARRPRSRGHRRG